MTESRMPALQTAWRESFERLDGDREGRLRAQTYLNASTAIYHDSVVPIGAIPKLYDTATLQQFDELVKTLNAILEKVMRRFREDASYRSLFGFSPMLERLIMLPTGYERLIPIMRADIFWNEQTGAFQFCELNTDGTSAMNEDREGANALALTTTYAELAPLLHVTPQELFDPWVEAFERIYRSSEQAVADPVVAIVDYGASATIFEFREFRRRFEEAGLRCLICDIPSLQYRDGALYGNDIDPDHPAHMLPLRIDAIYRRAVSAEIVAELETSAARDRGAWALVGATEDRSVCLIGGFVTHIAHAKQLFSVLHLPETHALLNSEEVAFVQRHVPYTTRLDSAHVDLGTVKLDRKQWIIKPEDGYASQGVFAGVDYSASDWTALIDEHAGGATGGATGGASATGDGSVLRSLAGDSTEGTGRSEGGEDGAGGGYVVQSYVRQYATPNIRVDDPDGTIEPWNILTGLYVYDGRFSGIFVRAGQKGIIVGTAGGITVPALLADYDDSSGLALRTREAQREDSV
ncbi:MAG: hypothetical protein LBI64_03150 [Coriobacteriales bacterium]|jgi:hypothetical protein|nr:hypothetical protein [Coriobacteriales bacterium]